MKVIAKHAIIKPGCVEGRGVEGAIDEALARLRAEFLEIHRRRGFKGLVSYDVKLDLVREPQESAT